MRTGTSSAGVKRPWGPVGSFDRSMVTLKMRPMSWPDSCLIQMRHALFVAYLRALWNKLDASCAGEQSSTVGSALIALIQSYHTPSPTPAFLTSLVTHTDEMPSEAMHKSCAGREASTSGSSAKDTSSHRTFLG